MARYLNIASHGTAFVLTFVDPLLCMHGIATFYAVDTLYHTSKRNRNKMQHHIMTLVGISTRIWYGVDQPYVVEFYRILIATFVLRNMCPRQGMLTKPLRKLYIRGILMVMGYNIVVPIGRSIIAQDGPFFAYMLLYGNYVLHALLT
jgi:hypothetical protein